MSIVVTTDVFCDGPGEITTDEHCIAWTEGLTNGSRSDAAGARRRAKVAGWVRRDGKDLCPECAAAMSS